VESVREYMLRQEGREGSRKSKRRPDADDDDLPLQRSKKAGKGKKREDRIIFEEGQRVWVVDEVDAVDPDLGEDVQEATIFGEMPRKKGWWQLEFGAGGLVNRWDYLDENIFTTKESATLHKLLV
jgi:hypothetical protein